MRNEIGRLARQVRRVALSLALIVGCSATAKPQRDQCPVCEQSESSQVANPPLPERLGSASKAFWKHWGDSRAELSAYRVTTPRYGKLRQGRAVLIYVTEPMDRRVWIKDDRGDVPDEYKVNVLKLNNVLKFRTGIYPYSVMTSTFAPVDRHAGRPRFTPVKIAFSAQEWCGHVYHQLKPADGKFYSQIRSYFQSEGDRSKWVDAPAGTLYEDALLIQLRELDGEFNAGKDWSGKLVPAVWESRKAHVALEPVSARITRQDADRDGTPVTRFELSYGKLERTYDIEKAAPHRVLGWSSSAGEKASLLKTARLPYWKLHDPGDEKYLEQLGLSSATQP